VDCCTDSPMRFATTILVTLVVSSALAQTPPPAVAPPVQTQPYVPPTIPILPPGLSSGDRELILLLVAERDRQYDQRFHAQEIAVAAALAAAKEAVAAALTAAKEAVDKAAAANDKHFDSVNEFRKTLTDQTASFPTRNEVDIKFKAIEDKISLLIQRDNQLAGRFEGGGAIWNGLIAVFGVLIGGGMLVLAFNRGTGRR
jgi:hypothetical protein